MRNFAVLLEKESRQVAEKIAELYPTPHAYKINETAYLLRTDKLSSDIAKELGIHGDCKDITESGVVIRLNPAYTGFFSPDLWEWFAVAEGK